jgi:hypothetical protein
MQNAYYSPLMFIYPSHLSLYNLCNWKSFKISLKINLFPDTLYANSWWISASYITSVLLTKDIPSMIV